LVQRKDQKVLLRDLKGGKLEYIISIKLTKTQRKLIKRYRDYAKVSAARSSSNCTKTPRLFRTFFLRVLERKSIKIDVPYFSLERRREVIFFSSLVVLPAT
jgi:hypothetical protein